MKIHDPISQDQPEEVNREKKLIYEPCNTYSRKMQIKKYGSDWSRFRCKRDNSEIFYRALQTFQNWKIGHWRNCNRGGTWEQSYFNKSTRGMTKINNVANIWSNRREIHIFQWIFYVLNAYGEKLMRLGSFLNFWTFSCWFYYKKHHSSSKMLRRRFRKTFKIFIWWRILLLFTDK